jgi:hypothetical protein
MVATTARKGTAGRKTENIKDARNKMENIENYIGLMHRCSGPASSFFPKFFTIPSAFELFERLSI